MGLFKRIVEFSLWFLQIQDISGPSQFPINEGHTLSKSKKCFNSPKNRQCWIPGFDINTDYEVETPPGKLREYDLVLENNIIDPDGFKVPGMTINGQYPGPLISANWGDTIRVTVHNKLTNLNGTSIHWHGIRQFETNWYDGVSGVTQCPLSPQEGNNTQIYEFNATQYGVSWYHSHFSLQYPDGILGPLQIHGPSSVNYDEDLGPFLISDFMHADAFSQFHHELAAGPPSTDSNILNGRGVFLCDPLTTANCTGTLPRTEVEFVKGKTYKMTIVNTSSEKHFTFWIDGHNMTVIGTDFVPIKPYHTDTINVAIGQRYSIIVEANAGIGKHGGDYWIHARGCQTPADVSTLGIIRYNPKSTEDPYTPAPDLYRLSYGCQDEPADQLIPIVPRTVGPPVNSVLDPDFLEAGLTPWEGPNATAPINTTLNGWILANSSLYIDWENPSLQHIQTGQEFPEHYAPIVLDYPTGSWVYYVIEGNFSQPEKVPRKEVPAAHPIHLHGHDFVILSQGDNEYTSDVKLNLHNPTRRDVAMLPVNGHLVIAFMVDNPGTWLMHCHIAFHASAGLALQFIEQPAKIKPLMQKAGVVDEFEQQCQDWTYWYENFNLKNGASQEDSGI